MSVNFIFIFFTLMFCLVYDTNTCVQICVYVFIDVYMYNYIKKLLLSLFKPFFTFSSIETGHHNEKHLKDKNSIKYVVSRIQKKFSLRTITMI